MPCDVVGDGEEDEWMEDSLELGALLAGEERVIDCGSHGARGSSGNFGGCAREPSVVLKRKFRFLVVRAGTW